jgi:hypothetical protein
VKNTLAERIMAEADTLRMIGLEPNLRNRALLTPLDGGGLRIDEACGLRWRDLTEREEGGQATVYGKGGKTRVVLLSASTWRVPTELRAEAQADDPVFRSRLEGPLTQSQVHRIVKAAAMRPGLSRQVSAHWLRHAHASHALDRGAPIHHVQATLGRPLSARAPVRELVTFFGRLIRSSAPRSAFHIKAERWPEAACSLRGDLCSKADVGPRPPAIHLGGWAFILVTSAPDPSQTS